MKMRAAHLGKRHSPETRAKMSVVQVERMRSSEARAKIRAFHTGKSVSPETCAKMRAANQRPEVRVKRQAGQKRRFYSPEACAKMRRTFTPEYRAKLRARRAQQIFPLKDTKPELAVQTWLQERAIEFTKHQHIPGLNHQWDIVIEPLRTLIEVDGCYWHGCPCRAGKSRISQSDIPCTAFAVAVGWTVIRIWECEIKAGDFRKLVFCAPLREAFVVAVGPLGISSKEQRRGACSKRGAVHVFLEVPMLTLEVLAELRRLEAAWIAADDASRYTRRLEYESLLRKHAPALFDTAAEALLSRDGVQR